MRILTLFLVLTLLAACGGAAPAATQPTPNTTPSSEAGGTTTTKTPVTISLGFIPNVQFAPFYVAMEKGFFADEGLEVTLEYGMENDFVQLVGSGERQFAAASGDQVLLARAKGVPVVYISTWYKKYPIAVASFNVDLSDPKNLEGHTVGLPGLFGASYVGWLALAQAANIDTEQVKLEAIGFNQVPVISEGRVDAIVGYTNNEPLQMTMLDKGPVSVADVSEYIALVANGLITNEKTIAERPELVQGVVRGFLRGLAYTLEHPDEAFDITVKSYVPEAGGENAETQRAVLNATLPLWQATPLGLTEAKDWETSADFMSKAALLDQEVEVSKAFTNQFVAQAALDQ